MTAESILWEDYLVPDVDLARQAFVHAPTQRNFDIMQAQFFAYLLAKYDLVTVH